jgi:KDO2-lipid IV(A) lauroyltransferase
MKISLKHRAEYAALRSLQEAANLCSRETARTAGAAFGRSIGWIWQSRRQIAHDNIQRAYPDYTPDQTERLVDAVFAHIGQTAFEVLRFEQSTPESLLETVEANSTESLAWAAREGRGAILLSGHIGNWEIFGAWIRALGYGVDLVVKPMRNPLTDRLLNDCRARHDVGIIHTQTATSGIVRALKKKRFVAILVDQYAGREGVEAEFFGRRVSTPRGPAALALKFGCPVLTGYLARKPDGGYYAHADEPIDYAATDNHDHDIAALTQIFTSRIEHYIRRHPDQWLWTHRRWGRRLQAQDSNS